MKNKAFKLASVLIAFAIVGCVGVAVAQFIFSNEVNVVINPAKTLVLSSNATEAYSGDTIRLSAVLSGGLSDRIVTFTMDGGPVGAAVSVDGVATLDVLAVNSGGSPLTAVFVASCEQ